MGKKKLHRCLAVQKDGSENTPGGDQATAVDVPFSSGGVHLSGAEYTRNSLCNQAMQLTPFPCVLGYQPPFFPWDSSPTEVSYVEDWNRTNQQVCTKAHKQLQGRALKQEYQVDHHQCPATLFQVSQQVWWSTKNLPPAAALVCTASHPSSAHHS